MAEQPLVEQVTQYLERLEGGDRSVVERLFELIYDDLRGLAGGILHASPGLTLQPTALVNEAYMRLVKHDGEGWNSRKHFFDVAAMAMRQLLTDHVRKRKAAKRGGDQERLMLEEVASQLYDDDAQRDPGADIEALDAALTQLEELDPRQAQIVRLRFLVGLPNEEVAEIVGASARTVRRDWLMARGWLRRAIDGDLGEATA